MQEAQNLLQAAGERMLSCAEDKIGGLAGQLTDYSDNGGKRGKGGPETATNIVETIDIGAPRRLVYDQWTRFADFPAFMKKVANIKQDSDTELTWKAPVFASHRS